MLVLTRRPGEQIVIAGNIKLTVVSIGPGRVKIGIEAPSDVRIDRQEIHDKIAAEQATDVLHAVARGATSDDPGPTFIAAGSETATLHNRIADQLPPVPTAAEPAVAAPRVRKPR
jgi:carbon storage regulator